MQKFATCLWFDGQAEEAMMFYTSVFKNSKAGHVARYGKNLPGAEGSVMTVEFELNGQNFLGLNGGPHFKFTPAISLVVNCETQEEIDNYWDRLLEGGSPQQCGWLTDKFGLSWQIVPAAFSEMMKSGTPAQSQKVMEAVMKMIKLDVKTLKQAYEQA
jgi:predicted 3-demethylubiquinone-9 3-methyltransferase (glyoxalase superfamily)